MKGIVFTCLQDLVEEKFGIETWDRLLKDLSFSSGGIYTAGGTYEDSELKELITKLASLLNVSPAQLTEDYGLYLFPILAKKYPTFIQEGMSLKDFIKSVDKIIHVEVYKLYPDASLPSINYEDAEPDQLILFYRSPRKLCALAVGLIKGASQYFNTPVRIQHPQCMHNNYEHCRLEIHFEK